MKNKKVLEIIFLSIFVIGLSALVISLTLKAKNQKVTEEKTTIATNEEKKTKEEILLKINKTDSDINLTISPLEDPIYLRAFALKVSLSTEGKLPKIDTDNFINPAFSSRGNWVFPIKKLTVNDKNKSINIELSGFIVNKPFYLENKTPIISIKLPGNSYQDFTLKSFSIDSEVTRFLNNSAESIFFQSTIEQ